jgi:hypothetical protein
MRPFGLRSAARLVRLFNFHWSMRKRGGGVRRHDRSWAMPASIGRGRDRLSGGEPNNGCRVFHPGPCARAFAERLPGAGNRTDWRPARVCRTVTLGSCFAKAARICRVIAMPRHAASRWRPPRQIRRGQIRRGQIRRGQIRRGQIRRGQIRRGQIRRAATRWSTGREAGREMDA